MVLLPKGLHALQQGATEVGVDLRGVYVDRDSGCDAKAHRQGIVNAGMLLTMQEPPATASAPSVGATSCSVPLSMPSG